MKNKTVKIGLVFIVVAVIALGIFLGRGKGTAPTTPAPLAPQAPPNESFIQPPKVAFSFTTTPTIPPALPTYQFQGATRASVEQLAQTAASSLNLQATPSSLQMTDTYTKTWARPNQAQLVVTQTKDGVTLSFQQILAIKGQPVKAPAAAASAFLSLFFSPTPAVSVIQIDASPGPFDGLLVLDPPNPPEYKKYNYRYYLGGYAIVTSGLNDNAAFVIVDSAGVVRSANIVPPPASIAPAGETPVLTPDQIRSSLSAGKGSLVNAYNPQDPAVGSAPVFSSFSVENTQIVYTPQNSQLLPAFLLSGTGTAEGGVTQKATFFLWAYPAP